jgi:hypothetical protein
VEGVDTRVWPKQFYRWPSGGLAKIFGRNAQWFVGVAGNPNGARRTSPANMNLLLSAQTLNNGINFILKKLKARFKPIVFFTRSISPTICLWED